jgi:hypothetical protein
MSEAMPQLTIPPVADDLAPKGAVVDIAAGQRMRDDATTAAELVRDRAEAAGQQDAVDPRVETLSREALRHRHAGCEHEATAKRIEEEAGAARLGAVRVVVGFALVGLAALGGLVGAWWLNTLAVQSDRDVVIGAVVAASAAGPLALGCAMTLWGRDARAKDVCLVSGCLAIAGGWAVATAAVFGAVDSDWLGWALGSVLAGYAVATALAVRIWVLQEQQAMELRRSAAAHARALACFDTSHQVAADAAAAVQRTRDSELLLQAEMLASRGKERIRIGHATGSNAVFHADAKTHEPTRPASPL